MVWEITGPDPEENPDRKGELPEAVQVNVDPLMEACKTILIVLPVQMESPRGKFVRMGAGLTVMV
jgi:hypothetical protein